MVINVWLPLVPKKHFSLGFSRGALSWLGPAYFLSGKVRHGVAVAIENGTPCTDLEGELLIIIKE